MPGVVPNEDVAEVTVDASVMPAPVTVKVADSFKNGLWGELPAIEPFASVYPPGPGGPMIKWLGPVGVPSTSKVPVPALMLNAHPVETVDPSVKEPSLATRGRWP
jgi:hypothetical protein